MKCPQCNQEHPDGTKFCPYTGEKIVMELNIICHNENCSNYQRRVIPFKSKLIPISDKSFALMSIDVAYEDWIIEKIGAVDTINDDFLSQSEMAVEWMLLNLDENPLFREIGLTSSNEIANNINVMESLGYLRIKNYMRPSPNHTFVASFVSNKRNSTGGYTFIVLFEEYMYVFNDVITEWTSYQEGVML